MLFFLDLLEALFLHPLEAWRELTTGGRISSAEFSRQMQRRTAKKLRQSWKSRRRV